MKSTYIHSISEHISLHEATLADAKKIFCAIDTHREDLRTWLPFVDNMKELADEKAFLSSVLAVPYEKRDIVFIIEQDEVFCGLIGFVNTDRENCKTEIGYWLIPPFRGRGIVTSAVKYLCNWAFNQRHIHRIQISCATENQPSNAVPRHLGFTHEGIEREAILLVSGQFADVNLYSMLKQNWKE